MKPWEKVRPMNNRLVGWWSISPSGGDASTRHIGYVAEHGWRSFVETQVRPWGFSRCLFHNGWGGHVGEQMQFTQFLQAQLGGPALAKVADAAEFVAAFRPLVDEGVEPIMYLGRPADYDNILGHPAFARSRAAVIRASVAHLIDAGVSVALDAASGEAKGSDTHALAEDLRARGVRVYIEALAPADATHWAGYPSMAVPWFIDHPDRASWNVRESDDETMILLNGAPDGEKWDKPADVRATVGRYLTTPARSVAIQTWAIEPLRKRGMTLADLVS